MARSTINWVAAYRNQARIDTAMQQLQALGGSGDLFKEDQVIAMLNRLYEGRDAEPQSMPPETENVIRRNMAVGSWKA